MKSDLSTVDQIIRGLRRVQYLTGLALIGTASVIMIGNVLLCLLLLFNDTQLVVTALT